MNQSNVFSRIRSSLPLFGSSSADSNDNDGSSDDDRNDNVLVRLLDIARRKFKDRELEGNINISVNIGSSTRSVSCDMKNTSCVGETNERIKEDEMNEEEELSRLERLAKSTMDYILNSLERRAISWKNKEYYKDITLSNSSSIQMPFLRILGASFTFSATVESLIISKYNKISGV